jgi:hypothetical protein
MIKARTDEPGSASKNTALKSKLIEIGGRIATDRIVGIDSYR